MPNEGIDTRIITPAMFAYHVSDGKWQPHRHLMKLDEKLVLVAMGKIKRLMVFMPPQHGKSTLISQYFPAWHLGIFPDKELLITSYGQELAAEHSGKSKEIFDANSYLFGSQLSGSRRAVHRWSSREGGGLFSAGKTGAITGKGGVGGIIDDPVKDREQSFSRIDRDLTWNWFNGTFSTRIREGGWIILVMTRWHHDDLAGRILEAVEKGDEQPWDILLLPALAEDGNDILGRDLDEPLCPELFSFDTLDKKRTSLGGHESFDWASLYQQRPFNLGGNYAKSEWWRYYDMKDLPECDLVIQSWDMAFKDGIKSSFVVGQVWGRYGPKRFLIDQVRFQGNFQRTIEEVLRLSAKWPKTRIKLVEDKGNGPAIISALYDRLDGLTPIDPTTSKEARFISVTPMIQSGHVFLPNPDHYPWVHNYIRELEDFPGAKFDDQVDATSQALNYIPTPLELSGSENVQFTGNRDFGGGIVDRGLGNIGGGPWSDMGDAPWNR